MSIDKKCFYWMKMCLLTKNVSIEWKCAYWMKRCLLTKNVPIEWISAYWLKWCILKNEGKKNAQLFSVFKCVCGINSPVFFFFFFFGWPIKKQKSSLSLSFSSVIIYFTKKKSVIIYCCCASNHWEPFYQPQSYWPKTGYCMWDPPFDFRLLTLNFEFWFNHLFPHATIPLYSLPRLLY